MSVFLPSRHRFFAALLILWFAGGGCARNPATGKREFSLVSEGQEIAMGKQYHPQVVATMGLYPDSALQAYVSALGLRLASLSERPNLPWTFSVVDDPVVNAFALPGGFIYVTRGIIAHFGSEAQLVSVLGHEIGHVTARHSASQMSQQQLAGLGLVVGAIVSPEVAQFSQLASAALGVLFLKFSRDDERQADDLGLRYMRRGGYAVREMPAVYTMLERVSGQGSGKRTPEWLATHPNPENRRERIEAEIAAMPPETRGQTVNRDAYLRQIDGMVFGDDPREGYFKENEFFHPELRFQITFPLGWNTQNQKQGVVAVSPSGDAMIQLSHAKEATADAAARAFFFQSGVSSGYPSQSPINGLRAVAAEFGAQTDRGVLRGYAAFVEHDGHVYRLVAYGPQSAWYGRQGTAVRSIDSFRRLTDRAVLDARPWRLEVFKASRVVTLAELARQRPSPVKLEMLAILNQVSADAAFGPGEQVKWVTGQPLP